MFEKFKNFINGDSKRITSDQEKFEEENIFVKTLGKTLGVNEGKICRMNYGNREAKRQYYTCECMDEIVTEIKREKTMQPLLGRTINDISKATLKNDYSFTSADENEMRAKQVKDRFEQILFNSSYEPRQFLRGLINNIVSFSNTFILPKRVEAKNKNSKNSKKNVLERVIIIQNKGWEVSKAIGTSFCEEWKFSTDTTGNGTEKKYNYKNVWHYTFNKEDDEIFGMPLWVGVIPDLRKNNHLINSAIDSYTDSSIQKNIYEVGVSKSGKSTHVTQSDYDNIKSELENFIDSDMVTNVPININSSQKTYSSPDKILDNLQFTIVAGLHTSKSQLGESGAGRQDAESQKENTTLIVEDFQENLEDWINKTFIKEICIDLFGSYDINNRVLFKFDKPFDTQERVDKHSTFLFQGGVIDIDEARKKCKLNKKFNIGRTFQKIYQQKEMNGDVEQKNSPKNQHTGTGGTGTTKKTKKD